MNEDHDSSIPRELRSSLREEPLEVRRRMERLWTLLGELRDDRPIDPPTDDAWADLVTSLDVDTADALSPRAPDRAARRQILSSRRAGNRRKTARGRVLGASAAVLTLLVLVGGWWFFSSVTITAPAGDRASVRLPDGSLVELNSETSVRYARAFGTRPFSTPAQRHVVLSGEAFFQVVPSETPFVVETEDARIEVLGTEFNVRARTGSGEEGTIVTLASGRVRLLARGVADRPLVLDRTGATARVSPATATSRNPLEETASLDHVLAWRRNGFAVVDRPLHAVLDEVERRYAIDISPRRGIDLSDSMSLFYLRGTTPDQILRDICLAQGCTYREVSHGFSLSAREPDGPGANGERPVR